MAAFLFYACILLEIWYSLPHLKAHFVQIKSCASKNAINISLNVWIALCHLKSLLCPHTVLSFYLNSNIMEVEFFCYNARCSGT